MTDLSGGWLLAAAVLGLAGLTVAKPRAALVLLLASLPLFAHKTRSAWGLPLMVLAAAFEVSYLLAQRPGWRGARRAIAGNTILLLATAYVAASVLSLASLPLEGIARQHLAALGLRPLSAWPEYLGNLLVLPETAREYSILSVLQTVEAFVLCLIAWREVRKTPSMVQSASAAITAGLAVFLAAGLLDFAGIISLMRWRGETGVYWDPAFTRLQSLAGNPGWFAQQVVYSLPFAVVLLVPGRARRWRLAAFLVLLSATAVALFLSLQRGSWVSGLAVVTVMAVGLGPRLSASEKGSGRRRPPAYRWFTATVAAGAVVVAAVLVWHDLAGGESSRWARPYLARVRALTDASSRLPYWQTGIMIGKLHPILGAGSESYGARYVEYFLMPGAIYQPEPVRAPIPASAHNVYLQVFAGKGLVGLALLVGVFAACFAAALPRLARSPAPNQPPSAGLLAATASLVGFAVYGLFQEIFYGPALQLLFFSVVAVIAALTGGGTGWPRRWRRALWALLAAAFAAHLLYEYVFPGPTRALRGEPAGFFAEERDPAGGTFRWTTERAWVPVPPSARAVSLEIRSVAPYPQRSELSVCGEHAGDVELKDEAWRPVQLPVGRPGCRSRPYLEIRTLPAWVPGADPRLLGVMVRKIHFR